MKSYLYLICFFFLSCTVVPNSRYTGDFNLKEFSWLCGRKIFLDPGHGGTGKSDSFRVAPNGLTEEEVNLKVSLILRDMLTGAGAVVCMSRESDVKVPLKSRVEKAHDFNPDIFISMHHNGSPRRIDGVNYPLVLIWGNAECRPESYEFAGLLLEEFEKIMKKKGLIVSDLSLFTESGSMVLRETRADCPGVIGEAGFYSDYDFAERLKDKEYNQKEAEAYFTAISRYFITGVPTAEVILHAGMFAGPMIEISADPGIKEAWIEPASIIASLDGLPVKIKLLKDNRFIIDYGKTVYPGDHELRFHFRNTLGRSSMFYTACFSIPVGKGDYWRLIRNGLGLINKKGASNTAEGLKMLLSAYSLSVTDPGSDDILWSIASAFNYLGERGKAYYYYFLLRECYPQSKYSALLSKYDLGDKLVADYKGKVIYAKYEQ